MKPLPNTADARLEVDGRVAVLTLDRDDIRNALTGSALIDDIVATVEWANAESGISALVLTGSGRAFSSGGNVKDMYARTADFAGEVAELDLNPVICRGEDIVAVDALIVRRAGAEDGE